MIYILAAIAIVLTHTVCFAAMTERKYSARKTALIYSLFCVIFVGAAIVIYSLLWEQIDFDRIVTLYYFITLVISFCVFMYASADPACKKIFLFISYSNIFTIFLYISSILCNVVFPDFPENATVYARNSIRTVLYIPAIWIYLRFLRPYIREMLGRQKKTWYSLSLVSLLFLIVFIAFLTNFSHIEQYTLLFAIAFLLYCSVLWIIFGTLQFMLQKNKTELIVQSTKYLNQQLENAKENEMLAKTIRHDFRHHNQNIASMLKKGKIQEAIRYLEQYNESLEAAAPREFCLNVTVNAILNSFYTKAHNAGISISIAADVQKETSISDVDFVAILSNLLENAVNGCKKCHSSGEIKVHIRTVNDKIVIVCSNPCEADLPIENHMLKHRGVGIDSIVMTTRKYDGDIRYSLENEVLTVCVILNI